MRSFRTKFIIYIIPLIFLTSFSFFIFFLTKTSELIERNLVEVGFSLVKNLSYSSQFAIASEDEIFLKPYLEGILEEEDVILVTVYDKKGNIIASRKKTEIEERIPVHVMEELLISKNVLREVGYTGGGEKIYNFYSPVFASEIFDSSDVQAQKKLVGFARVGLSLEKITISAKAIITIGLVVTIFVIFLGFVTSFFLATSFTRPIEQLKKGAEAITQGKLDYLLKIKTGDEIEGLAESFNQMASSLGQSKVSLEESKAVLEVKVKAKTRALEEEKASLDRKVKERTQELQTKIAELEKFHKLTVGRELKMIELKEEIKKLEKKLEKE